MIQLPPGLIETLSAEVIGVFLVFLRVSAMSSLLPAFGERTLPVRVKLAVASAFTLIISPAVQPASTSPDLTQFAGLVLTEILIGLAFGIGVRLFILALQTAGSVAAQSTSLSQILGGAAVEPIPAMGYVLVMAALALAVAAGLHVRVAEFLILSYQLLPMGTVPAAPDLSHWGVRRIADAFGFAVGLAAPFLIISLIYNLTLGVINRAMPQLMVSFVGAPAITMGGMLMLLVSFPVMLSVWADALFGFFQDPLGLIP